MKVWMDRNVCDVNMAACEGCFAQFLLSGQPDRFCMMRVEDDGSDTITAVLHSENHTRTLVIPAEMREEVAYEGWPRYVSFEPAFRKNEGNEALHK